MEISTAILKVYVPVFRAWSKESEPEREELYAAAKDAIEMVGRRHTFSVIFETDDTTREPWIEFAGPGWTDAQGKAAESETSTSVGLIETISRSQKSLNAGKPSKRIAIDVG